MKFSPEKIVENMSGGGLVYQATGDEKILYASAETARLFECDTVEEFLHFVGGTFKNVVYAEDVSEVERTIWDQLEKSGGYDYVKYRIITKNGTFKNIEDWGRLVHDEEHGDLFYAHLYDESVRDRLIDISMEREAKNRRMEQTDADPLTGLPDEAYFFAKAPEIIREYLLEGKKPVIAYLNVCGFRAYNQSYGHDGGDRLLKTIAEKLRASFSGEKDVAARLNDDHFAVLSAEGDIRYAADELNGVVRNVRRGAKIEVKCGAFQIEDAQYDLSDALRFAQIACDKIKSDFGTRLSYYDHAADQRARLRNYISDHFDDALRAGRIRVHYQPIVDMKTGEVVLMEALSRWEDAEFGNIRPADFLSVLEERRQTYKLDLYMIEQTCREIRRRLDDGARAYPASINISATDFTQVDMAKMVDIRVRAHKIPKEYLHLEISENDLARDTDRLKAEIGRFRDNGFQIWVDDFGSAALSIIQEIDLDGLKIDMKLVQSYAENGKAGHVLTALIDLAGKLGIKALAKGVEEDGQMSFLKKAGCDLAQGYLIGKPTPDYGAVQTK